MAAEALGEAALGRIEWLTLALGGAAAVWASLRWGWRGGVGLALGTTLSWINFRWLKTGVRSFARAANAHEGAAEVRVPASAYVKFIGRFVLLLGAVYVILTRSSLPAIPVFVGLFASAAGVVASLVYELASSGIKQSVSGKP